MPSVAVDASELSATPPSSRTAVDPSELSATPPARRTAVDASELSATPPPSKDPLNWSNRYNTPLSPADEKQFQGWKQKYAPNDTGADYDLRGAFKAGVTPDGDRGHFPDTFKKPNHPTFSDESQYSGKDGFTGGHWGDGTYTPSATNLHMRSPQELQQYFQRNEPNTKLLAQATDPVHAKPQRAEDLPSHQDFENSHQTAVERLRSYFQPAIDAVSKPVSDLTGKIRAVSEIPIAPLLQNVLRPPTQYEEPAPTTTAGKIAQGVGAGATKVAEGLTTPENLALLAGTAGVGMLPKIGAYLPRAVSAVFGASMLKSAYDKIAEVKAAIEKGDAKAAAQAITEAVGTGMLGVAAGAHAAGVGAGVSRETPAVDRAKPGAVETAAASAQAGMDALNHGRIAVDTSELSAEPPARPRAVGAAELAAMPPSRVAVDASELSAEPPQAEAPATAAPQVTAEPPTPETASKPLWEMSHDELAGAEQEAKTRDQSDLTDLFGADGAQRYKRLERVANSTTRDYKETAAASQELEQMEAALPESGRNRLFGIGDDRPQLDDIRQYRQALGRLDWTSPEALGDSLKWAVTGIGDKENPADMTPDERVRYAQLRYGMGEAQKLGWDPVQVSEAALRGAAGRFDPGDVGLMLRRFARPGPEVPIERPEIGGAQPETDPNLGRDATVYTPKETKADVQYQLVNAPDLVTSFDKGYDQDLQPRETDRIGSRQRIEELKGTLNPEKLAESVNAGDGAPITLPDNQVVAGNHRTVALRELYDAGHPKGEEYKAWLQENAPRFGLKPEDVAALDQPVLVRRLTNPGDKADLVRFAEEANMATTARMSDAEQAQMLAKRITGPVMEAFDPREDGTPNPEFVQAVLAGLPAQERAAFMDSKGQISQSGIRTLRGAVFAKAYPDVTAIERMAESADSNVRNVSNGMLAAAPQFARLQEAIAAGDRHPLGIERETAQASEILNSLKDQGLTVPQWLSQENLFGRDPVVDKLVETFAENRRSAKRIGDVLKLYTDLVDRLGSPKQEGLFGADKLPNRAELIEAANETVRQRNAADAQAGKAGELFAEGAPSRGGEAGADGDARTAETGKPQNPVIKNVLDQRTAAEKVEAIKSNAKIRERGAIDPSLLALGADKFIERDVAPAARNIATALSEAGDQALRLVAPDLRSTSAELTGLTLRVRMSQFARRYDQARSRLRDAWKFFDRRTADQNYSFMDDVERGLGRGAAGAPENAALEPIARTLARSLDQRRREVQALGEGALERFYANYFPHLFEKPEAVPQFVSKFFGDKANMEGAKSFLKRREFPTMAEARAAGLKPISDNPIELVLAKIREMDRYLLAHATLRDLAERGIAKRVSGSEADTGQMDLLEGAPLKKDWLVPTREDLPPGYVSIHDPIGGGKWFADEGAAQVLNNYLTPGLRSKSGAVRLAIGLNNSLNQANLGLSAFHITGETIRSVMNRNALGLKDIFQGHPVRGSVRIVTAPAGPFIDYLQGAKGVREWFKPGSEGAPIAAMIDGLMQGGARANVERDYINGAAASMMREAKAGNFPGALARAIPAFFETTSKPMMQQLIPRIKLGAAMQMAEQELGRLPADADVDQTRRAMAKVWDSVDNRMGQMVYSNLFWNQTMKDIAHLGIRAVGWDLGTVREFGGGVKDAAGLLHGEQPVTYDRIAYTISAAMTTALIGAMYQYAHTGKGPQEVKDYFFPKREDGTRISMPTDIKDIYHYLTAPVRTLENKASPLLNTTLELLHNRDFYDRPIREEGDPLYQQGKQVLDFLFRQTVPFTLQPSQGKRKFIETNPEHKVENYLGITRASGDIQDNQKPRRGPKSPY